LYFNFLSNYIISKHSDNFQHDGEGTNISSHRDLRKLTVHSVTTTTADVFSSATDKTNVVTSIHQTGSSSRLNTVFSEVTADDMTQFFDQHILKLSFRISSDGENIFISALRNEK